PEPDRRAGVRALAPSSRRRLPERGCGHRGAGRRPDLRGVDRGLARRRHGLRDGRMVAAPVTAMPDLVPPPLHLPAGYERHHADASSQRTAILHLASGDEPDQSWPALTEYLLALGRTDVPLARLTEGHVDSLRILDQAGTKPVPGAAYGVWASRSRSSGIAARRNGDRWVLGGTLRFASGAGVVDR